MISYIILDCSAIVTKSCPVYPSFHRFVPLSDISQYHAVIQIYPIKQ